MQVSYLRTLRMLKISIGSDHAGFELKERIKKHFSSIDWIDFGTNNPERMDYPDVALKLALFVSKNKNRKGILVCGSGIGMCIAANKISGVRAAVVESVESATLSRAHNDSNILCLGARLLSREKTMKIIQAWMKTPFEKGRHSKRLRKIKVYEKSNG